MSALACPDGKLARSSCWGAATSGAYTSRVAVSDSGRFQYIAICGSRWSRADRSAWSPCAWPTASRRWCSFSTWNVADKWNRKRTMIAADLARGAILVPVAAAGLTNTLAAVGLGDGRVLIEAATSYFAPPTAR